MIPPKFNVARLRKYFEELAPGQIGRIHLMVGFYYVFSAFIFNAIWFFFKILSLFFNIEKKTFLKFFYLLYLVL